MKSAYGLSIPQTPEEVCDPRRVALLVYDMQVGVLSQIKNADVVTQQVLKVLTAARDAGLRGFFSRHLSLPKELMGMFQYRMAFQQPDRFVMFQCLLGCSNHQNRSRVGCVCATCQEFP